MKHFVLDASVALTWFIDSPVPTYAVRIRELLLTGARPHVPALWHLEMANGIVIAERRRILSADEAQAALRSLENLTSQAVETHDELVFFKHVANSARTFTLSAYDSVYLDLARRLGFPLAALDRGLRSAISRAGIEVFQ